MKYILLLTFQQPYKLSGDIDSSGHQLVHLDFVFTFEIGINGDPSVEKMPDRNNSKRHKTTPGQKNENKKALRLSFGRHE